MAPPHPSSSVNPSSGMDIEDQSRMLPVSAPTLVKNIHVIAKCLLILAATIGLTAVIAALGVLTAPVAAALLVVFLITYYSTRPIELPFLQNDKYKRLRKGLQISFYSVALILFVTLIILFIIFRTVYRSENKAINHIKIWKWLEIALVSCLFSCIWIIGRLLWSHVHAEYGYMENLVSLVNASRWAVNTLCFFIGELLIIQIAPESKHRVFIYGIAIWKWIALIDLIICGSLVVTIVTESITLVLSYEQRCATVKSKDNLVYMTKQLGPSINFLLFMVLTLLSWVFYVNDRLDLRGVDQSSKDFLFYAKRTFIAVLIGSVLWVVKNFALALWEVRQVYQRFTDRLTNTWRQMYLIISLAGLDEAQIVHWHIWDRLKIEDIDKITDEDYKKKLVIRKQRRDENAKGVITQISNRITRQTITYEVLKQIAGHIVAAEEIWSKEDENENAAADHRTVQFLISQFLEKWKATCVPDPNGVTATGNDDPNKNEQAATTKGEYHQNKNKKAATTEDDHLNTKEDGRKQMNKAATMEDLRKKIEKAITVKPERKDFKLSESDMKILYKQLEGVDLTRTEVWLGDLEKWLLRACRSCKTLGRALAGNKEVVTYLDKVLIGAIIGFVLISWIFLAKLDSTEAIAAIISSIAAVAFIFGETTKTLFQGMAFAFGVHPFDVGDVCVINDTEALEVKRIGIWKTVFLKEGCNDDEVIYPNSALIGYTIVKHNKTLERRDYLEIMVSNSTINNNNNEAIYELRKKIKRYLKEQKEKYEYKSSLVVVKDIGEKVKIGVTFKHLMSFQDMTYLDCLKKKNKSTSQLLEQIRVYVNEYDEEITKKDENSSN